MAIALSDEYLVLVVVAVEWNLLPSALNLDHPHSEVRRALFSGYQPPDCRLHPGHLRLFLSHL